MNLTAAYRSRKWNRRTAKGGLFIKNLLHTVTDRLQAARKPGAVLSPRAIRREALPYFSGWVVIFTWLYCYFLPNGNLLFLGEASLSGHERTATYVWLIACPLITSFSKGVRYVPMTVYSVAAAIASFLLQTFVQLSPAVNLGLDLIMAAAVGHIFASCGYGFFMVLNNAEKFYSMILGIFFTKATHAAASTGSRSSAWDFLFRSDSVLLFAVPAGLFRLLHQGPGAVAKCRKSAFSQAGLVADGPCVCRFGV